MNLRSCHKPGLGLTKPKGETTMTIPTARTADTYPVGPVLSMYDPVYLGVDEFGEAVYARLIYRNLLAGGEPGGGKSGLLNIIVAHVALSLNTRMVLFDGKQVELGMWDDVADEFVGPDLDHAIITLRRLQRVMDNRYSWLRAHRRRKIEPADNVSVIASIFDEIALYSATLGTEQQQKEFIALLRDLVARGRAAAMPVIAATQRPSVDIIPKSLRDIFGYRAAFRCTSSGSSNIILGDGWSEAGFSATDISPTNQGVAYLIAEGGVPRRVKVAYLSDSDISSLANYAACTRRTANAAPIPLATHVA
jgi:DNA segregation ATPase FtsK/SpoIIIE, S-DNA-T family